ncbi:hypothetical protein Slala04_18980 [Streptomyces lavendulae subsp. lavendulae]|nr:hypothetical protein Slala04_18980 [Streptomyces lavendulae subsp. lavendulae]
MSGAKEPRTSAEATRGPRARPVRRTAGSTAAAWLRVKGMAPLLDVPCAFLYFGPMRSKGPDSMRDRYMDVGMW